jgi:hypothetical protein
MFFDSSSNNSVIDTIDGTSFTFSYTRVSFSPEISLWLVDIRLAVIQMRKSHLTTIFT